MVGVEKHPKPAPSTTKTTLRSRVLKKSSDCLEVGARRGAAAGGPSGGPRAAGRPRRSQPPDQSHGEPQTTPPTTKWGQGPREESFPRRAQRPPAGPSGGLAGLPACRDGEAPATPPGDPSPAARPPGPPPPSGRAAGPPPRPTSSPGARREGSGGGTAGTGAGLQVAGRGRRGRGGGGAGHVARPGRAEPRGLPLPVTSAAGGTRAGSAALGAFRGGPRGLRDAFSPLREPRARAGAPGRGLWKSLPAATSAAGRRAPARDPGGRRAGCDPAGWPAASPRTCGPLVLLNRRRALDQTGVLSSPLLPVFAFLFGKHSFRGPRSEFGC